MITPKVKTFFDADTCTATHLAICPETKRTAIIDSVHDYDPASGRTSTKSADEVIAYVEQEGLTVAWVLETHAHADHLSAAPYLKKRFGAPIGIGFNITAVQSAFAPLFDAVSPWATDGSQFDKLLADEETFRFGEVEVRALWTPGHTPACMTYVMGEVAFVGDTLFMPDFGTARCDFPGGDARALYRSIQRILSLPPQTRLYVGHDYKSPSRDRYAWETTVADELAENKHVGGGKTEDEFVQMRQTRDATLPMPKLIFQSIQVNVNGGRLPPPGPNGIRHLKIPIDAV